MKLSALAIELVALLIACAAFAMGFNEMHGAQIMLGASADAAQIGEAVRLLEQAHSMFTAAATCGGIFLALFIVRIIRNAALATDQAAKRATGRVTASS